MCKIPQETFNFLGYTFASELLVEDGLSVYHRTSVKEEGAGARAEDLAKQLNRIMVGWANA